jgi:hypothetical protein
MPDGASGLKAPPVASHGFWSGVEPGHLVEFFGDLARWWPGWSGDKVLSTVEDDLGCVQPMTAKATCCSGFA